MVKSCSYMYAWVIITVTGDIFACIEYFYYTIIYVRNIFNAGLWVFLQCGITFEYSLHHFSPLPLQGSRFEISAVGSLCLPKLVYYTPSAFHSKHVLRHLSDSHRLHINTRAAVSYIQQLEDMEGQHSHLNAFPLLEQVCELIWVQF